MPVIVTLYEPLRRCVCGRDCNWVDPFIPKRKRRRRTRLYGFSEPAMAYDFSGEVDIMRNGASSSYQALQAQFRHRFKHGLQALLSYTRSHSIDNVSSDANYRNVPPGASSDRWLLDFRHPAHLLRRRFL